MADLFVTFNGLRLDRHGFCLARDITDLTRSGPLRGSDYTAQGVAGDTYRPKVQGSHVAICSFLVFGNVDSAGVAHPDRWSGFRDNIEEIEAALKTASLDALQALTVTYPDGGTRSADAWCRDVVPGQWQDDTTGAVHGLVVEFVIPAGSLS